MAARNVFSLIRFDDWGRTNASSHEVFVRGRIFGNVNNFEIGTRLS